MLVTIACRVVAVVALLTIFTEFCAAGIASQPKPETSGEIGQLAYDDLAGFYIDPQKQPDITGVIQRLQGPDAASRKAASQYLLAFFRQLTADERNGRAVWKRLPFFGGGSESAARSFRKQAAEEFAKAAATDDALEAAVWLIDNDELTEIQTAGVTVLRRLHSPAAIAAYKKLLSPPHHNAGVVCGLLEEISARKLIELAPEVSPLCLHYRPSVRDAARKAAAALHLPEPPPFHPEEAFTPWLQEELRDIAAMVLTEIPADAKWCRFVGSAKEEGIRPLAQSPEEFSAWLLEEGRDTYRVLDLFGNERSLSRDDTKVSGRQISQDVEEFLKIRNPATKEQDGFDRPLDKLSERGGLTGQFQPEFIRLPEGLLAAWAFSHGDKASAAAVIFPRMDAAGDERWVKMVCRDTIGWHYNDALLHAFCYDRDYPASIRFAAHLSKPQFEGYQYHARAKELAEQLAARGGDFTTLRLPTPTQWGDLKKTLNRPAQIEYLAARLRLLNCFQWGQPGGVDFSESQSDRPQQSIQFHVKTKDEANAVEVVNPYSELTAMKLAVSDLLPLIASLADENFIPTYSYWRDFHPARTMYRVNYLVTNLVNRVAKCDLADMETYSSLDADGKRQHLMHITEWVNANAGKSVTALLLETLATTKKWNIFRSAASELIGARDKSAVAALSSRLTDFPENRAELAEICFQLSPADFVDQARIWTDKDKVAQNNTCRFWSAMILLHSGDRNKLEGLDILKELLEHDDGSFYYPRAFEELLGSKNEECVKVACGVLPKLTWHTSRGEEPAMVQRLILLGRQEAIDYCLKMLDSAENAATSFGHFEGKEVQRQVVIGDNIAQAIAAWRDDHYEYPAFAPDDVRAGERSKLKQWFIEQIKLRNAGQKSGLREAANPLPISQWHLDAP